MRWWIATVLLCTTILLTWIERHADFLSPPDANTRPDKVKLGVVNCYVVLILAFFVTAIVID